MVDTKNQNDRGINKPPLRRDAGEHTKNSQIDALFGALTPEYRRALVETGFANDVVKAAENYAGEEGKEVVVYWSGFAAYNIKNIEAVKAVIETLSDPIAVRTIEDYGEFGIEVGYWIGFTACESRDKAKAVNVAWILGRYELLEELKLAEPERKSELLASLGDAVYKSVNSESFDLMHTLEQVLSSHRHR